MARFLLQQWPANVRVKEALSSTMMENDRHTCVLNGQGVHQHYCDVIMGRLASQITSLTSVYSIVYSEADQRKHQSSAPLAFVRGIHPWPVNSPHKWPVTWKMFPFDDVIMNISNETCTRVGVLCAGNSGEVWDEIIYPFPNFNGATVEVWEWKIISLHTL